MAGALGNRGFRDLVAWQKADALAAAVYAAMQHVGPRDRWLVDHVLRCAVSVPANLAEGHGRGSRAELLHFIDIARGSLSELQYFVHFMSSNGIITADMGELLEQQRAEAGRVLFALWRSLKAMDRDGWDHSGRMVRDDEGFYVASP